MDPRFQFVMAVRKIFSAALHRVGMIEQDQPRKYCYVTQPIDSADGDKQAYVVPYHGLRLTVTIDFPHLMIGRQKIDLDVNDQSFTQKLLEPELLVL